MVTYKLYYCLFYNSIFWCENIIFTRWYLIRKCALKVFLQFLNSSETVLEKVDNKEMIIYWNIIYRNYQGSLFLSVTQVTVTAGGRYFSKFQQLYQKTLLVKAIHCRLWRLFPGNFFVAAIFPNNDRYWVYYESPTQKQPNGLFWEINQISELWAKSQQEFIS